MTKTQTPRSDATATASDCGRKKPTRAVTDGDVARRAYDLYVARGREDGHDVDDHGVF